MVLRFWKKRAVKFVKNEEVEISLKNQEDTLPEVFITRIISQSPRNVLMQLPLSRKGKIQAGESIVVHFRRKNQLGSFKSSIADVWSEEVPPVFSITTPSSIFWEEIVPSRLAMRDILHTKERKTFLQVTYEETLFDAVLKQVGEEGLIFSGPVLCEPARSLKMVLGLPGKVITCEAQVMSSTPEGDGFATTVAPTNLSEEDRAMIIEYYGNTRRE